VAARPLLFPALALLTKLLAAQGPTSAALQGSVTGPDGRPVAGASVSVANAATGERWQLTTPPTGRYVLENLSVGGPYMIEVRALGFQPTRFAGVILTLGQRYTADVVLQQTAIELEALNVTSTGDPLINAGRTGPGQSVSDSTIVKLPNIARDLTTLALLSPQVSPRPGGAFSIAGQNQDFNALHVDGGANTDLYIGRLPGAASAPAALPQVLPRPISTETLQELQVLVAPFDVRLGGFAGGLLNAVTKSGTNAVHGSAYSFLQNNHLVGIDSAGLPASPFTSWEYGATLSGPLVHDRLHYFLSAELHDQVAPDPGPIVSDTAGGADTLRTGIRYASAARFQSILSNYGLDPGTLGPVTGHLPAQDLFAKVTAQLRTGGTWELSDHYAHGTRRNFVDRNFGTYLLSSTSEADRSAVNASRLIWHALLDVRWSNELILSYLHVRDTCRPNAEFPRILVFADRGLLLAGPNLACPTQRMEQGAFEFTDNVTTGFGRHYVTVGTHDELLHFTDAVLVGSAGLWRFDNLDSLQAGHARHYERGLPGPLHPAGPVADFHVRQVGVYAQDRWVVSPRLTLTAGLRVEVPFFPDATATNPALETALGIDTGKLPSGNMLWSPRLGWSYDLEGDGRLRIRGGVGLFSGPPPYRWLGNAYHDGGLQEEFLSCDGQAVPPFDPVNQPTTCGVGPKPRVSVFDPGLRFPQNLRVALGADHRLPLNVVGTVDLLYTVGLQQFYLSDANLESPVGVSLGEGGRPLYGSIDPATGTTTPARRTAAFGQVVRVSNRSGDRAFSIAVQLQKRVGRLDLNAFYTFSHALDLMSLVNFASAPNLQNTPLDGTFDDRRRRTSFFDTPHRVSVFGTVNLPGRTTVSIEYAGASGTPYTYVVDGDANADGIGVGGAAARNDIVYVPRNASPSGDISLGSATDYAKLDAFIAGERCLRTQRGRIMTRNSCRNGWLGFLNARLTKSVPTARGQTIEILLDVFNVLNLLNRSWGRYRITTSDPSIPLLKLRGYDPALDRGVYQLELPARNQIADAASRWRLQLGAQYVF
jgi:carboxypeptidase family protein/TonB-dependent receptor-like protein